MAHATVDQVAQLLNLTPRRIQQLQKEGLPREGRGQYNLLACVRWYVKYLQDALEARGPTGTQENADIASERKRLISAQAERAEMENESRRRTLLPAQMVLDVWTNIVSGVKQRMLGIPSKLAPQLVNVPDAVVIAGRIKDEIDRSLVELASGEFLEFAFDEEHDESGAEGVPAAAASDRQPVGGPAPATID